MDRRSDEWMEGFGEDGMDGWMDEWREGVGADGVGMEGVGKDRLKRIG